MRLLLDECVPKRLKRELLGHDVQTVQDMGWAGIKNGALLKLADGQFDALLTVDQGIEYQQNLSGLRIGVVVMLAASNDVDDLRPLLPGVEHALASLRPGETMRVGGSHSNGAGAPEGLCDHTAPARGSVKRWTDGRSTSLAKVGKEPRCELLARQPTGRKIEHQPLLFVDRASISLPFRIRNVSVAAWPMRLFPSMKAWLFTNEKQRAAALSVSEA